MSATLLRSASLGAAPTRTTSRALIAGRILTGLAVAFLTFDTVVKLFVTPQAVEGTTKLGWSLEHMPILAAIEAVCLVLYLVPRTAPIGALLWTGYLGGAIATQLRVDNPLFSHILFPTYVAALIWGGLYLRDARVRAVLGPRQ
jgi:hypothetical protein